MESLSLGVLFFSAFVSATLAPGGSEALLGALLFQTNFPRWQLWASATFGNTLGAMTTWILGALLARGWFARRRVPDRPSRWLRRFGLPALLFSWLPVVGDGLCLAAGWLRLPWVPGLALIAVGKGFRYGVLVWWFG